MSELCGVLGVYKPMGWTSFDVVAKLRGIFKTRRIGHGGTLDPMAEGVLPVMVGRAAKAIDICPDTRKEYEAGFKLGLSSDTQDITGELVTRSPRDVSRQEVEQAAAGFVGELTQIPPMYSAVKVDGKRLYELAREGKSVERRPRKIIVHSITVNSYDEPSRQGTLTISCGKGTYVRTLIADMGEKLGVGGVMTSLKRTYSGGVGIEDCLSIIEIEKRVREEGAGSVLMPVEKVFGSLPEIVLEEGLEPLYRNGVKLRPEQVGCEPDERMYRVYGAQGFVGVGQFDKGLFKTVKFFT